MQLLLNTSVADECFFGPIYLDWEDTSNKLRKELLAKLKACKKVPQDAGIFRACECDPGGLLAAGDLWNKISDEDREAIAAWFEEKFNAEQKELCSL